VLVGQSNLMHGGAVSDFEKCTWRGGTWSSWKRAQAPSSFPFVPGSWGERASRG